MVVNNIITSNTTKMKKLPLISILVPTYNCEQFIEEAINSILSQEYDNLEIIVVDDGSTDNTEEIVKRIVETRHVLSLPNIRYFRKEHSGISETRNMCLEKAKGEYIAWCDADDYWLQGKLQAQMEYFAQNPDCQIVFTKYRNFLHPENITISPKIKHELELEKRYKTYLPSALIKKEVFEQVGIFNKKLTISEDSNFIFRMNLAKINTEHYVDKVFYNRRLHQNNITLKTDIHPINLKHVANNIRKLRFSHK